MKQNIRLEILTEEASMENFLRTILPKILPSEYALDQNCFIHSHEGKSDLKKSIPKKLKAYPHFPNPVKLLIVHDQDSNDCKELKQELQSLCRQTQIPVLIRIACKELENWYLGDMQAIEKVYPKSKMTNLKNKRKFRDTDQIFGADELESLIIGFSKTYASREIPKHMKVDNNNSKSFNHLIEGIKKLLS